MINFISGKPYFLFAVLIPVFLLFSFIIPNETLDVNIHDTYLIIRYFDLVILLSLFYGFLAIIYFILIKLNFSLIKWIVITHTLFTIKGVFLLVLFFQVIRIIKPEGIPFFLNPNNFYERINWGIFITSFIIIITQVLFFINAIYALIKGRR